jgi:hypothetical protein
LKPPANETNPHARTWGILLAVLAALGGVFLGKEYLSGEPNVRIVGGALMVVGIAWQASEALTSTAYRKSRGYWGARFVFLLGLLVGAAYTITHQ